MTEGRFASVRKLFGGAALSSPREEDDAPQGNRGAGAAEPAGPTEDAINAVVASERANASTEATKTANDRWNAVMTSAQGKGRPAVAARLLNSTTMSADDVKATLDDMGEAPAAAAAPAGNGKGAERNRLAGDPAADPDTGGAAAATAASRRGEGDDDKSAGVTAQREKRKTAAAAAAAAGKGKLANAATDA